jgi:hypothetical protein
MTRRALLTFPNAVCWDGARRAEVLNPIALDLPLPIFRATHHPSLVQREGTVAGVVLAVDESELLEEFLSPSHSHVFIAAVGDTGTGKSHFVRWLYLETQRALAGGNARHVVIIPRSAANLAEVVRLVLQDFEGDATARLRAEVERHRGLSESEARQRVLDELAIVVENSLPTDGDDDEMQYLREKIPALLRDQEIRRSLTREQSGIVPRLARHVLGQRESAEPENLRWAPADLELPVQAIDKAGADAAELASALLTDDRLRAAAAAMLQHAIGTAISALLRFRSGDLKRALNEIRAQLASQGRELVVLLEDLSITEGLDGELLEALQVRTHDSGVRLCTLRSIVGLTREDYQRLRDNIKARLTRTLWFDAPIGHGTVVSEDAALAQFAGRYLNAARLAPEVLDEWSMGTPTEEVPSACEACPLRGACHTAFGAIDGYGLYPFSSTALGRLYRLVVSPDGSSRPFKPRSLLRVLNDTLDQAEQGLPRRDFPTMALIKAFGLGSTTAELQLALRSELGVDGDRVLRAIELYSEQPAVARPTLLASIAAAFGLPAPKWSSRGSEGGPSPTSTPTPVPAREPAEPTLDGYDQWLRGDTPPDKAVNLWRQTVLEAVLAGIEWDVEGIGYLRSAFRSVTIRIEGQKTGTPDVALTIARTPEAAVTLRVLSEWPRRHAENTETLLRTARLQIEKWAEEVRKHIAQRSLPSVGIDAVQIGLELLALGAFIRGLRPAGEGAFLDACMRADWDKDWGRGRGAAWTALVRGYVKYGVKVRDLVHHALACTKGGQAGAFLDPTSIMGALRGLRRGNLPTHVVDETTQWRAFRDIAELARVVALHLPAAIAEERAAVDEWLTAVGQQLGSDSPADVMAWIADSLETAASAGSGDTSLRKAIAELEGRAVKGSLDAAQKVASAGDATGSLVELGKLDRPLMTEIARTLEQSATVMVDVERRLRQRVDDALGTKTPEAWLLEITDRLDRITAAYSELLGEDAEHE